jgi:hypothetical protein
MSASKNRPRWSELPAYVRDQIGELAGGRVIAAENCEGGFSPGFASRLTLADGQLAFAKAMDADAWQLQATMYRDEARVAALLPATVPAPRFLGSADDGHWVILAFDCADGAQPSVPWHPGELAQAAAAASAMSQALTPSPVAVPADHPRLGGWAELAAEPSARAKLAAVSAWAARNVGLLAELERAGLAAARGDTLVHFDALPHNIVRTDRRVLFVDWPHARLGAVHRLADRAGQRGWYRDRPRLTGRAGCHRRRRTRHTRRYARGAYRVLAGRRASGPAARAPADRRGQARARPRRAELAAAAAYQY